MDTQSVICVNNKKSVNSTKFRGEIGIVLCSILWGCISVFSIPLTELGFSSAQITFVRSVLSTLFLGVFILVKDRRMFVVSVKDLPLLAFLGIGCFMAVCIFYTRSIEENGSSLAAMLMYTSPVWVIIMSRFIFKEKLTTVKTLALCGLLGGCALLSFGGELKISVSGILIGLATGLTLACYVVFGKLANKKYSAETTTFYVFLFSAVGAAFIAPAWEVPALIGKTPVSLLYLTGLSMFSTTIAYLCYSAGLKTVSAGKASMLSTLEIVVATIVGIFYNVDVGVWGYVGIVITILSLVFLEIKGSPKRAT